MTNKLTSEEVKSLCDLPLDIDRKVLKEIAKDLGVEIDELSDVEAYTVLKENVLLLRKELGAFINNNVAPITFTDLVDLSPDELSDLEDQVTLMLFELHY